MNEGMDDWKDAWMIVSMDAFMYLWADERMEGWMKK